MKIYLVNESFHPFFESGKEFAEVMEKYYTGIGNNDRCVFISPVVPYLDSSKWIPEEMHDRLVKSIERLVLSPIPVEIAIFITWLIDNDDFNTLHSDLYNTYKEAPYIECVGRWNSKSRLELTKYGDFIRFSSLDKAFGWILKDAFYYHLQKPSDKAENEIRTIFDYITIIANLTAEKAKERSVIPDKYLPFVIPS